MTCLTANIAAKASIANIEDWCVCESKVRRPRCMTDKNRRLDFGSVNSEPNRNSVFGKSNELLKTLTTLKRNILPLMMQTLCVFL